MKTVPGSREVLIVTSIFLAPGAGATVAGYEEVIYYHSDALGSPVLATDINGNVLWREQYTPYGSRLLYESREVDCGPDNCTPVESPWDEKQWFTGKLEETRAGIQYFGARWYEPELGRFMSADPVLFQEDNIFSFNRYAYANNNPLRYADPDGREVTLVGASLALPEVFGIFQEVIGREIEVSGFTAGVAWSYPGESGQGEYDIALYLTSHINSKGGDTGRFALSYSNSVDDAASVKDLAGVGGGASLGLGPGGFDLTYSEDGFEMIGIHIGPGIGGTVRGEATAIWSAKHGQVGFSGYKEKTDESNIVKKKELD
jgi:RHS repeat-associated protein